MAALGMFLLPRLERMPGSSRWNTAIASIAGWRIWKIFLREHLNSHSAGTDEGTTFPLNASAEAWSPPESGRAPRFGPSSKRRGRGGIPQLLDIYLLRSFLYYFFLLTVGFVL